MVSVALRASRSSFYPTASDSFALAFARRVGEANLPSAPFGFFFDAGVVTEARRWAEEIMSALPLDQNVEVHVGPPDAVIHGREYRQQRLGTIESVIADRRTTQSSGRAWRAADRER